MVLQFLLLGFRNRALLDTGIATHTLQRVLKRF